MPYYRVWYQNKTEPLEFSTAGIYREEAIVERILAHENVAGYTGSVNGEAPANGATLKELIEKNKLAPIRYTEDESEPHEIA